MRDNNQKVMTTRPLISAGILLGIGLGGLLNGILMNQIFQLHSMFSARLPQDQIAMVKESMVWDGIIHLFSWMITGIAVLVLWNAMMQHDIMRSGRIVAGAFIAGWGIFNSAEGLINHHFLEVHHIVEKFGLSIYDYIYIGAGIVFMLAGFLIIQKEIKKRRSNSILI
jgi:uncharacterized membrane protein